MASLLRAGDGRLRSGWRFLLALLAVAAAQALAQFVAVAAAGGDFRATQAVFWPLLLGLLLGGFALLLRGADRVPAPLLAAQGVGRSPRWGRDLLWGLLIGSGLIAAAVAVLALSGAVHLDFETRFTGDTVLTALLVTFILGSAAMAEEVMFRGYPFQRLSEAVGPAGAILLLSVLFGAAHLSNPHAALWSWGFLNTVLVGVLFALAYLRTRALWLPFGLHFAWNFTLGVVFGLPVSGLRDFAVIVRATADGPEWLTGGAYGIEGSALATLLILGGTAVLLVSRRHPAASQAGGSFLPPAYMHALRGGGIQPEEGAASP